MGLSGSGTLLGIAVRFPHIVSGQGVHDRDCVYHGSAVQLLSILYVVTPELALVTGTRSLYSLGSSQARKLEEFNILPSRHSASSTSNTRGGAKRLFPPTAPPTVRSQSVFRGSGRSSCEYGSSGSVPDSSSAGNQGSPDSNVDPICVDRVLVPVCEVCVPLPALAVGSVEAACSPHLPADPASDVTVTLVLLLWRTEAAVMVVGVTGPSLPVYPLVTTIMSLLSNSVFTGQFSSRSNGTRCALQAKHRLC